MSIDKILEEIQIKIYHYRQRNEGKSPCLVMNYNLLCHLSGNLVAIIGGGEVRHKLMGCEVKMLDALNDDQIIIGEIVEVKI